MGETLTGPSKVIMLFCPPDRVLGYPMYPGCPLSFTRQSFIETLAFGYWPAGSVFRCAPVYLGATAVWMVFGRQLKEIGGKRAILTDFRYGHPRLKLIAGKDE